MSAESPEASLAPDDENQQFSEAAENLDNDIRDMASDLTDFDVRTHRPREEGKLGAWLRLFAIVAPFTFAAFLILVVVLLGYQASKDNGTGISGAPVDLSTTAATPAPVEAAGTPPGSEPSTTAFAGTGELSGVWEMFWFNSEGDYRVAFTVVFNGSDGGTIDLLNDEYEYDTGSGLDGNDVWFAFTRDFGSGGEVAPPGDVAERSLFTGSFVGPDEIEGLWIRDDWSCDADRNCEVTPGKEVDGVISYLFREP